MYIKQLSIFIENKVGRLQAIMDTLSENGINIRALSIAETTEFGILRIITPDVEKAKKVLREVDVISKITDVIAVYIDDQAGGLAKMLKCITAAEVNVEYMYAFLGRTEGKALMVLKADDEAKAEKALVASGMELASPEIIYFNKVKNKGAGSLRVQLLIYTFDAKLLFTASPAGAYRFAFHDIYLRKHIRRTPKIFGYTP